MDNKHNSEVAIVVECPNNRNKYKQFNIHADCHIHYNNDTLHLFNCRTYHQKYLIACTAIKNNNILVDLHCGEHYFYHVLKKPITLQVYDDLYDENLRRQITEEKCFYISKINTPFVIISENITEIFSSISQN